MTKEDEIIERLDLIVQLLIPPAQSDAGKSRDKVIALCDLQHTREDMMKLTSLKAGALDMVLKRLRDEGLVRTVKRGKSTVYLRLR